MAAAIHTWHFFRAGGFDQVRLDTGADVAHLEYLDLKLWAALSCPVKGLEFDERTLALIDADGDGRVRASEILAAIAFAKARLRSLDSLVKGEAAMPVAVVDDATDAGKVMIAAIRRILAAAGRPDAASITTDDIAQVVDSINRTQFNGDGVIPPTAAEDDTTRSAIVDLIATHGSAKDRAGEPGVTEDRVNAFYGDLAAFAAWWGRAEDPASGIWPLGQASLAALAALDAVKGKVDDFFARCRLAAFDPRAEAALNRNEEDYLKIAGADLAITSVEIGSFPLAHISAGAALPLSGAVNPAWVERVAALRDQVVTPLLGSGRQTLGEAEWAAVCARFVPTRAWLAGKAGAAVERLGPTRVRALLDDGSRERIASLIARDRAVAGEFDAMAPIEKLVRLHRDLFRLLHNFVNFADFYSPRRLATFQAGTLYLDSRGSELCVRVGDMAKHAVLAGMSKTYIAYCDCVRPGADKMTIAAGFTSGDADYLLVGRNGVFIDRKGRDWDATIVKLIENPISIRQAFWSPYKRAIRFVEEFIAKRAAVADEAANTRLVTGIEKTVMAAETGTKVKEKPKFDIGVVAALGVGLGAIGTILGGLVTGFIGLKWWMPVGVLGIILAISGPSMVIAWLKLRQRNLGPILDANGWAVNGRVKINIPFGGSLTTMASLPPHSVRLLNDPYAEKQRPWRTYILMAVLLAVVGYIAFDRLRNKTWIWQNPERMWRLVGLEDTPPAPAAPPPAGGIKTP